MNVTDIAAELSAEYGMTKVAARAITAGIIGGIASALVSGDEVRLKGLGTLRPIARAPRAGTGPNGVAWQAPAKMTIRFRPSSTLRDALNQ